MVGLSRENLGCGHARQQCRFRVAEQFAESKRFAQAGDHRRLGVIVATDPV
jgi:hypothetical protein